MDYAILINKIKSAIDQELQFKIDAQRQSDMDSAREAEANINSLKNMLGEISGLQKAGNYKPETLAGIIKQYADSNSEYDKQASSTIISILNKTFESKENKVRQLLNETRSLLNEADPHQVAADRQISQIINVVSSVKGNDGTGTITILDQSGNRKSYRVPNDTIEYSKRFMNNKPTGVVVNSADFMKLLDSKKLSEAKSISDMRVYLEDSLGIDTGDMTDAQVAKKYSDIMSGIGAKDQAQSGSYMSKLIKENKQLLEYGMDNSDAVSVMIYDILQNTNPKPDRTKDDTSGPHATLGTTLDQYTYDLTDITSEGWSPEDIDQV